MTQIIFALIAFVIIFSYIKPALMSIKSTQDEIFQYTDALDKASELNQQLASLVSIENSFKTSDKLALGAYMPDEVDDMLVMADISAIAEASGMRISILSSGDLIIPDNDVLLDGRRVEPKKTSHIDFELSINGRYQAFKSFLSLLEQNKYPLEIIGLSFGEFISDDIEIVTESTAIDGDYNLILRAYAYSHTGY